MKKSGDCKLCLAKGIEYTKSDIVPKWFIKGFKEGPHGGKYVDLLQPGKEGYPGKLDDAYFVDDEALCRECNNERFSAWEQPSKKFYNQYLTGNGPHDYGPWFYSFCTSISWRVVTYLRRVGDNPAILDNPHVADALESWRLFMRTGEPAHIKGHCQHLFLTDPKYTQGIGKSFRLFDVVHLTAQADRQVTDILETIVGSYRPEEVHHVTAAKSKIRQAGWRDDLLVLTFLGCFTLIGLAGTDDPERWKKCGRLAVHGGRLELLNSMNFRVLLANLNHDLNVWLRLHEKGDEKMAHLYYATMIEPGAAALCHAANQ